MSSFVCLLLLQRSKVSIAGTCAFKSTLENRRKLKEKG